MDIIAETLGSLGRIRLNRPKAINAITLGMVRAIGDTLNRFAADPLISVVLLTGEGERGLCAGGDLRAIYESDGLAASDIFWREEYRLNARIAAFEKPFVAVMDGITMGGGVGLASHAGHRIVTERSRVATPETGIGFVPDVGQTWLLARAPGEIGTYLGLTGETVPGADAIFAGLADLLVDSADLQGLIAALAALPLKASDDAVRTLLESYATPPPAAKLAERRAVIDACFAHHTVDDILTALKADGSAFALQTSETLRAKAPVSLVLTLRLLRLAREATTLEACLENEFHAALARLDSGDFREGIRAAVIDKDRTPRWQPATLGAVDPVAVARLVEPRTARLFPEQV